MTAKDYLSQAWRINHIIDAKLEQVCKLRALATKATSTLSPTPPNGTRNTKSMEDIIIKMLEMENDINEDIDRLVNLKRDICEIIYGIDNPIYRLLLEFRYLCFKSWDRISVELGYERRYTLKLHDRALLEVEKKWTLKDTSFSV